MSETRSALSITYQTDDGAQISADYFEGGPHAVLLAHGKVYDKASWAGEIPELLAHGLSLLAPDFRGYGASVGPEAADGYARDITAGVAFLRQRGARAVSIIGGSMGAMAAAEAVIGGRVEDILALILLAPRKISQPVGCYTRKVLFITTDNDTATAVAAKQQLISPDTTSLTVLDGDWHGQRLFTSPHRDRVLRMIKDALPADPD